MLELSPSRQDLFRHSGRWSETSSGSLLASWSGASISFACLSSRITSVHIRTGPQTERKDSDNGGTKMLAWTISPSSTGKQLTRTCDAAETTSGTITLLDTQYLSALAEDETVLTITVTMIDWASALELEAILFDTKDTDALLPPPKPRPTKILFVGDSMLVGFTDGTHSMPNGCLDAFPYRLPLELRHTHGMDVDVEVVATPGVTLVDRKNPDGMDGVARGLAHKFFKASPWNSDGPDVPLSTGDRTSIIVIELGTNDESEEVTPDHFITTTRAFVVRLLESYKHTKHVCFVLPFRDYNAPVDKPLSPHFPMMLDAIAQDLQAKQLGVGLHIWDIGSVLLSEHTLDGLHPTLEGHVVLCQRLVKEIIPILTQ